MIKTTIPHPKFNHGILVRDSTSFASSCESFVLDVWGHLGSDYADIVEQELRLAAHNNAAEVDTNAILKKAVLEIEGE